MDLNKLAKSTAKEQEWWMTAYIYKGEKHDAFQFPYISKIIHNLDKGRQQKLHMIWQ